MEKLFKKKCIPCTKETPSLSSERISRLLEEINPSWELIEGNKLKRVFKFKNFKEAMNIANTFGDIAEEQFHHPELQIGWGYVTAIIWTHKINGLVESDFILAAKFDQVYDEE